MGKWLPQTQSFIHAGVSLATPPGWPYVIRMMSWSANTAQRSTAVLGTAATPTFIVDKNYQNLIV